MIILDQIIYYTCRETWNLHRYGLAALRVRGREALALRGLVRGQQVVKLITPRFTPLLYIRQEIKSVSRFSAKNFSKCGQPHRNTIPNRTLRAASL
jgi:hypothetical protein